MAKLELIVSRAYQVDQRMDPRGPKAVSVNPWAPVFVRPLTDAVG
jgi:hypothetical protein